MKEINLLNVLNEKYNSYNNVKKLEIDHHGFAVHYGKISPGCTTCFFQKGCDRSIFIGTKCPFECTMCFYDRNITSDVDIQVQENIDYYKEKFYDDEYFPSNITYNSHGETFYYLDYYAKVYPYVKKIEDKKGYRIHKRIYTTGIFANRENLQKCKELDIDEVRFHVSASNFSKEVLNNMKIANEMGFRLTVEEPLWPPNEDKLKELFPYFEEIGLNHLNLNEVDVTQGNVVRIFKNYPQARIYKNMNYHLYNDGMFTRLVSYVAENNYSFSVLECSSDLAKMRLSDHLQDIDNNIYLNPSFIDVKHVLSNDSVHDLKTRNKESL